MATFVFTWNPDRYPDLLDMWRDELETLRAGGTPSESWATHSTAVTAGDRAFLLRQGAEPRGIIACGRVASEPYVAQHFRRPSPGREDHEAGAATIERPPHFVDVEWDTAVDLATPLPTAVLLERVPEAPWNRMFYSGYRISEEAGDAVQSLWRDFLGPASRATGAEAEESEGEAAAAGEAEAEGGRAAAGQEAAPPTAPAPNRPAVPLPARRLLRTFAFDPMSTRLSGRFLVVDVPFERDLQPGPQGSLVVVVDYDPARRRWYEPLDLNDPAVLAQDGLRPVENDPRAHQQVVYAVTMSVVERFERFLGRRFRWRGTARLRLVPHAFEGRNAYFDPARGAVLFGYYPADRRDPGANLPGQMIFTCLSSDIIAHEVTHAIIHRLRKYFMEATNPDVYAWHEAFADLVALFQHFVHRDVVVEAVSTSSANLRRSTGLLELAQEFGRSTGRGAALRSAIGTEPDPKRFLMTTEPHARGAMFVAAVFDAFLEDHQRAIADLLRIATGGTGVLPAGRISPDLVGRVADEAVTSADRLLGMTVRAFDYLPVVDVTFGDVVRAIVTADRKLYPDDAINLRATLVECMRRRGIHPDRVTSLAEEALMWPGPSTPLSLTRTREPVDLSAFVLTATMNLDPSGSAGVEGRRVFAQVTDWARHHALEIGLHPGMPIQLAGLHVAYRQTQDRQPLPEIVVQLVQRRRDLEDQGLDENLRTVHRAGTVLIAAVDGTVEYVIAKPLPLTPDVLATLPPGHAAHAHHEAGERRLRSLRQWLDGLEAADALSPWTLQPAAARIDFAAIRQSTEEALP